MKQQEILLKRSKDIFDEAVLIHRPDVVLMMFSGGDDSLTAYHVARQLGIKINFVLHGNTGCGIPDTTAFARNEVAKLGDKYLEANAGRAYEEYVIRKGFFGKGNHAHGFSYNVLKLNQFRRVISASIVKRKRNVKIMLLNGARRTESERRKITMINPIKIDKGRQNQIWVNLINDWEKSDCLDFLDGNGIKRNQVSVNLCRSGECMCGTMQTEGDRVEASFFYPIWGKWLDDLESRAIKLHGFGWNDKGPPKIQTEAIEIFQPMCTGCKMNYDLNQEIYGSPS
jgi:3'-phosphoadenosine 5'-phosphosulfate sulfotransferase (PAPS reductase)/FAD synthetase